MDKDDEEFSPALERMLKAVWVLLGASSVAFLTSGKWISAIATGFFIAMYYMRYPEKPRCTGEGTVWPLALKLLALQGLLIPFVAEAYAIEIYFIGDSPLGFMFLGLGIHLRMITIFYVKRLGKRPPTKKRARVLKPALNKT